MTIENNIRLLSLIIHKDKHVISEFIEKNNIDFRNYSEFLRANRIDGFLYYYLKENNLADIVSSDVYTHYRFHYEYQLARNNKLIDEAVYLQNLTSQHDIDSIFLKGPLFTLRFYNDLGQREIADLDLLIRRNGIIEKTDRILTDSGYIRRSVPLFGKGNTVRFTHHYEYIKNGVKLDLHWVLQNHYSYNIDYERIWKTRQLISIRDTGFYTLCEEYELVFRILSIFMDIQLGTIRLKSFIDLYMIIDRSDKYVEWSDFFDARKKEGLYIISMNVIDLVLDLLQCRETFCKLSGFIANQSGAIVYDDRNQKLQIFESQRFSIRNKYWAFRCYNAPIYKSLLWWFASLPVKLLIYKEASAKSLKRFYKR